MAEHQLGGGIAVLCSASTGKVREDRAVCAGWGVAGAMAAHLPSRCLRPGVKTGRNLAKSGHKTIRYCSAGGWHCTYAQHYNSCRVTRGRKLHGSL